VIPVPFAAAAPHVIGGDSTPVGKGLTSKVLAHSIKSIPTGTSGERTRWSAPASPIAGT
jgi:hypothetical protein